MKKLLVALALLALATVSPAALSLGGGDDSMQIPGCGTVTPKTDIWNNPMFDLYIDGFTQSTRPLDGCAIKMRVESWIDGASGHVYVAENFGPAVSVFFSEPMPRPGEWTAIGKHWSISLGFWLWNGYSKATATVRHKSEPAPDPAFECAQQGAEYYWDGGQCQYTPGSPIIVDVGRDGYKLTSAADGVRFDIDADGVAEQVAWTRADTDDAFLALDRNGNGTIDDGTELFGNATPAYAGQRVLRATNGFEALKFLQGPDYGVSYTDDRIDSRDCVFARLVLWTDRNHNGLSEPDELQPASVAGLQAIGTEYKLKKRVDKDGNEFRQKGTVIWTDGATEPVYDIWLKRLR